MKVNGFFVEDILDRLPDNEDITPYLSAMGFVCVVYNILENLDEDGSLFEAYEQDAEGTLRNLELPEFDEHRLAAVYDTEDGPIALYLNPISGIAFEHQDYKDEFEVALEHIYTIYGEASLMSDFHNLALDCLIHRKPFLAIPCDDPHFEDICRLIHEKTGRKGNKVADRELKDYLAALKSREDVQKDSDVWDSFLHWQDEGGLRFSKLASKSKDYRQRTAEDGS